MTSTPRPARAAGSVSERFTAEPTPTVCSRDAARQRLQHVGHDLLLEADGAVGHQHDLPLRLRAQRRQRLHERVAHLGRPARLERAQPRARLGPRLACPRAPACASSGAARSRTRSSRACRRRRACRPAPPSRARACISGSPAIEPDVSRRKNRSRGTVVVAASARRRHQRQQAVRLRRVRLAVGRPPDVERQPRLPARPPASAPRRRDRARVALLDEPDDPVAAHRERVRRRLRAPPLGDRVAHRQRQPRPRRQRRVGDVDRHARRCPRRAPPRPGSAASPPSESATPTRPRRASAASDRSSAPPPPRRPAGCCRSPA